VPECPRSRQTAADELPNESRGGWWRRLGLFEHELADQGQNGVWLLGGQHVSGISEAYEPQVVWRKCGSELFGIRDRHGRVELARKK